jgi:hypothetical protein
VAIGFRLSPALRREIDAFAFAYPTYFPEFFFPAASGGLPDFGRELQWLRDIDEQLARLEFAIALIGSEAGAEDPREPNAEATRQIIDAQATAAEMERDGQLTLLRPGTNDWVCVPGNQNIIGTTDMCLDWTGPLSSYS